MNLNEIIASWQAEIDVMDMGEAFPDFGDYVYDGSNVDRIIETSVLSGFVEDVVNAFEEAGITEYQFDWFLTDICGGDAVEANCTISYYDGGLRTCKAKFTTCY